MKYGELSQYLQNLGFRLHRLERDGEETRYYEISGKGGPELFLPAW